MKHLLVVFILMTSTYAFACIDQELKDIEEIGFIQDRATALPNAGLTVTSEMFHLVAGVADLSGTGCTQADLVTKSFVTKSGKLYHVVHTNEDRCDGGNSAGVVLNANLKAVAKVEDATFGCYQK